MIRKLLFILAAFLIITAPITGYSEPEKPAGDAGRPEFRFSDFNPFLVYSTLLIGAAGLACFFEFDFDLVRISGNTALDESIQSHFYDEDQEPYDMLVSPLGMPVYPLLLSPFLFYPIFTDYPDNLRKPFLVFLSIALNEGVQQVTTHLVSRDRPDGTDDESFFSGHASHAFNIASFYSADIITHTEGRKRYLAALPYLASSIIAFGRLYENKHYFTDTLLGVGVGTVTGNLFYFMYYDRSGKFRKDRKLILPSLDVERSGISFSVSYFF